MIKTGILQKIIDMKKKFIAICLLVLSFFLTGCKSVSFSQGEIIRDSYNTGGNLTFDYDANSCTAYFGGQGEFVEFYEVDIAKGWSEEGNRSGFKLFVPQGVEDYKSATAILSGKEMESAEFIVGDSVKYALFQPIVDCQTTNLDLKIKWQSNAEEQVYKIVIKNGTNFLNNQQKM